MWRGVGVEVGGRVVSVAVALLAENLDAQHFYRTNFFRKCEKMQVAGDNTVLDPMTGGGWVFDTWSGFFCSEKPNQVYIYKYTV